MDICFCRISGDMDFMCWSIIASRSAGVLALIMFSACCASIICCAICFSSWHSAFGTAAPLCTLLFVVLRPHVAPHHRMPAGTGSVHGGCFEYQLKAKARSLTCRFPATGSRPRLPAFFAAFKWGQSQLIRGRLRLGVRVNFHPTKNPRQQNA